MALGFPNSKGPSGFSRWRTRISSQKSIRRISVLAIITLLAQFAVASVVFTPSTASAAVADSTTSCGVFGTGTSFGTDITIKPLHGKAFYTDLKNGVNATYVGYEIQNKTNANIDNVWVQIGNFRTTTVGTASVLNIANAADSALPVSPADPTASPSGRVAANSSSFVYFLIKATDVSSVTQRHDIRIYKGDPSQGGVAYPTAGTGYNCYYDLNGVKRTLAASANKVTQITTDAAAKLGGLVTVTVKGATGTGGAGDSTLDADAMWMSPASTTAWPTRALRLEAVSLVIKYKKNDPSAQWQTYSNSLLVKDIACSSGVNGCKSFTSATTYTATYKFRVIGKAATSPEVLPVAQIASGTQMKHTGTYPATITFIPDPSTSISVSKALDSAKPATVSSGIVTAYYKVTITNLDTAADATVDEVLDIPGSTVTYVAGSLKVVDKYRTAAGGTLVTPEPTAKDATGRYHFGGPFTVAASGTATLYYTMSIPVPATLPATATNVAYGVIGPTLVGSSANNVIDCSLVISSSTTTTPGSCVEQPPEKLAQSITFNQPPSQGAGTSYVLDATASSGLAVSYTIVSGPCLISGDSVVYQAQGTCVIRASQAGNGTYAAATDFDRSVVILPQQIITFPQPTSMTTGSTQNVTITASSGLYVTLTTLDNTLCKVGNSTSTPADSYTAVAGDSNLFKITALTSKGNCPLTATQNGGLTGGITYGPALAVDRTVNIGLATQVLTTEPTAPASNYSSATTSVDWNVTPRIGTSTGTALNLPVTFTSQTPAVCTASDGVETKTGSTYQYYKSTISISQSGLCVIQANQDGYDASGIQSLYGAAEPIQISFTIGSTPSVTISTVSAVKSGNSFDVKVVVAKTSGSLGEPAGTLTLYTSGDHTTDPVLVGTPLVTELAGTSSKYVFRVSASTLPATGSSGSISLFATFSSSNTGNYNNSQTVSPTLVEVYSPAAVLITPSKNPVTIGENYTALIEVIGNSAYGTPAGTITLTVADATSGSITTTMPATLSAGKVTANLTAGSDATKYMVLDASYAPASPSTTYFDSQAHSVSTLTTRTVDITPLSKNVTYNANFPASGSGATSGTVPAAPTSTEVGTQVTVLGNTNNLAKLGYTFAGWNTAASGTGGTAYNAADTFTMPSNDVTLYAQYTLNVYSVTYNDNGATTTTVPTDSTGYNYGNTVTVKPRGVIAKTGFSFGGWNTLADGTGTNYLDSPAGTFTITANTVLYAKWVQITKTVSYNVNGATTGTVPPGGAATYNYGASVTVLGNTGNLVKFGYTFAGWNTQADGNGTSYSSADTFNINTDTVLYAKWTVNTHTVTYLGNGSTGGSGPSVSGNSFAYGATVNVDTTAGTFVRTGYSFTGWNTAALGGGNSYSSGGTTSFTMGDADVSLHAQWSINSYNVTYDSNNGTGGTLPANTTSRVFASTVTVLGNTGNLVKLGSTFVGWNTQADGNGTNYAANGTASFVMPASNVTLYAKWSLNSFRVTYDANGATAGSAPTDSNAHTYQQTVTVLSKPVGLEKTGYTFAGWRAAADGTGTSYTPAGTFLMPDGDVTLYAEWTINRYTVTYDANGSSNGTVPVDSSSPYNYNSTVTVKANSGNLTIPGYRFDGWNTQADGGGTNRAPSSTFTLGTGDVILYAQWVINPHSVLYNANGATGGSVPIDSTNYNYNTTVTVATNSGTLVRVGYTFDGWRTGTSGGTLRATGSTFAMPDSDVTLYAKWLPKTHTVTYHANNATSGTVPVDNDSPYTFGTGQVTVLGNSGVLAKSGALFVGWNTAANGTGTSYVAGAKFDLPDADVVLYAKWATNPHNVTYHASSGVSNQSGSVPTDANSYEAGNSVTVAGNNTLSKPGHTLTGWSTADGSGTTYSVGSTFTMPDAHVHLYSVWTVNSHTITYLGNSNTGGTAPSDGHGPYNYNSQATVLGNPGSLVRTGYTFTGWNTLANGQGTHYKADLSETFNFPDQNVTLYAEWAINKHRVLYDANSATGGSAPIDSATYDYNSMAPATSNSGLLTRTGYTFAGWNSQADGLGTGYSASGTNQVTMPDADVTLYAKWTKNAYAVSYNPNNGTGSAPGTANYDFAASASVSANTSLTKYGHTFSKWNTRADGTGTNYLAADSFTMPAANVELFAIWTPNKHRIIYDGNSPTAGTPPADATQYDYASTVPVTSSTGTLEKTGYTLIGWNTAPDGSGTTYSSTGVSTLILPDSDVTLYAMWSASVPPGNNNSSTPDQALSVFVWLDLDGDGIQDPDEPNLPGLTLEVNSAPAATMFRATVNVISNVLTGPVLGSLAAAALTTSTTDASGYLKLNSVPVGGWIIQAMLPTKLSATQDSDANPDGQIQALIRAGDVISTWMGVQGHAKIDSPIYDSKNLPTNEEIEVLWEGLDEKLLSWDDVSLLKDPETGILKLSGLPSGNYRLIRVGATPSDSECVDIVLEEFKTFKEPIITQKSYVCTTSAAAIKNGKPLNPAHSGNGGLANTGAALWLENWVVISASLIALGSLIIALPRKTQPRRRKNGHLN